MIDIKVMPKLKPGAKVRVYERVLIDLETGKKEKGKGKEKKESKSSKERISKFEGIILARKHGSEQGATFTVRATVAGVGVEKVYPIHSPLISRVDIVSAPQRVRRAKLYYLRNLSAKGARAKLETK
ncbi:MAG: 50S ribosomal protein L19 [Candidatus Colwellbacteria bacterium]|nr:50S ribosomal protein L19 [Candidatus Colwellbacteria bacterium]